MNVLRRRKIADLKAQLEGISSEIETLQAEEQEYFDAMPESLQGGEKGQRAQAAAEALESAFDGLNDVIGYLDTAGE